MGFLTPLFLLGALAVAGPVIFHLIRRTTRERTAFSSLLFLQPDPPRLTERSRVDHWLLLLLRAAALALLALAFARPFFKSESSPELVDGTAKRLVLLVDFSASMRRAGLWDGALAKAETFVRKAGPADAVAVLTFGDGTNSLMDFKEWVALPADQRVAQAMARLKAAQPSWEGTDLSQALITGAELLRESPGGGVPVPEGGEIGLVTDFQEGSRLSGLQGLDWPQGTVVTMAVVAPEAPGNAGIALVAPGAVLPGAGDPPARVRVWNSGDSQGERFLLGWASADAKAFSGLAQDVYVPPGQARVVSLDWPGDAPGPARLLLRGDAEPFDNVIYAVPPATARVSAFYCGEESPEDPKQLLFFLNRALPQSPLVTVDLKPLPLSAVLPAAEPGKSEVYFITGSPSAGQASALRARMESGALGVVVLTKAEQADSLAVLAGVESVRIAETPMKADEYAILSGIDFKHPLFAPFADPRFSDFTKIRFWHHRQLTADALPGSRVVAGFDSGDPAVLELPVGKGRMVVLTSGWQPADSQLALSTKFVPLIASLLESGGVIRTPSTQFVVGAPVPRPALGFAPDVEVTVSRPDGKLEMMEATAGSFTNTPEPGIYSASAQGRVQAFAVNEDPSESKTLPLPVEELEKLGVPVAGAHADAAVGSSDPQPDPNAVETEGRQKLWRWIIAVALGVLLLETLLAGLAARRAPTAPAV